MHPFIKRFLFCISFLFLILFIPQKIFAAPPFCSPTHSGSCDTNGVQVCEIDSRFHGSTLFCTTAGLSAFYCCEGAPLPTPTPSNTPTPFPFDCSDQGNLDFECFSGGCPTNWVPSNQSPTTCSAGYSCCWYNTPPATSTPGPTTAIVSTPTTGVCTNGTTRYDCSPDSAASCNVDACVGLPQECQNGAWVVTNSAGECTTACTNCTHIGDPTSTPADTPVPPGGATVTPAATLPPAATATPIPTPLPAPTLSFSCSGDPGTLTASWSPVVGASTYAIRIDDKANAWGGDSPLFGKS